jgi:hypothetical protein
MISFKGRYNYMNTQNLSTKKMSKKGVDFVATVGVTSFALTTTNGANDVFQFKKHPEKFTKRRT